jgi:histidinol phosphatase-like PHP family hydrolase
MLDNLAIADLFAREAEGATGHLQRALRRAAHSAFLWLEEAAEVWAAGRPLTEMSGIGPVLARRLQQWLEAPLSTLEVPPIRQEFLTLASARRILQAAPDWRARLQGDLQMHTVWSDGAGTVAEMAATAAERGYRYIGITDHTKGLKIAGGLDENRLLQQGREIDALNKTLRKQGTNLTVLRSAEVNLSPEGESDMPASSLKQLDLVLGCFHSALRREEDQTARYVKALRNPDIQILGHPQTRIWNRRLGLKADWHRVFAEAARLDKAVEIDGDPARQDLRVSLLKIARQEGARISLGTDAHAPEQFIYMGEKPAESRAHQRD